MDLRQVVLAGPRPDLQALDVEGLDVEDVFGVLTASQVLVSAVVESGHRDVRQRTLPAQVTARLVLGLCLFAPEGYAAVMRRCWRQLPPAFAGRSVATPEALSQARVRLPAAVMQRLFRISAAAPGVDMPGSRRFGMEVTATDGTVFDLPNTEGIRERFATPSGGRFPQARVVTLVSCGTRRVIGAQMDSCAVSEQVLWDRLVDQLRAGTLNTSDRNFFSMHRWQAASATGAHLIWRVKNGKSSLPAKVIEALPDGSYLVGLQESDGMLRRRREVSGDPTAARMDDITARLVEFCVTVTDEAGKKTTSRFRVLTTLLDPDAYPAQEIAECYAERWQVELTYKTIKSTLRGPGRRLRGHAPDLVEQEVWGLLTVYNALIDQAVAAAVDLDVDPDEISFVAVLRATRDHFAPTTPCANCGHHPVRDPGNLTAAITAAPRNRTGRRRTSPRSTKNRRTQHTRNVVYTIDVVETNLPTLVQVA